MSERLTTFVHTKGAVFLLTLVPAAILLLLRPIGMDLRQSAVLAALVVTILWWITGVVERTIASAFLLLVFLLISGAPVKTVFTFPLSENFLLIVFSFLFSQGISNSGLVDRLLQPMLNRFGRTPLRLVGMMVLSAFVMAFIIPQPFSRIILLSLIYDNYLTRMGLEHERKAALMLGLYLVSILVNMTMIRGDIILNNALLTMSGVAMSEGTWMTYMTVPTLLYLVLALGLYFVLFRVPLQESRPLLDVPQTQDHKGRISNEEKRNLILILLTVAIWTTEELHGLSGTIIVIAATLLMIPFGMLKRPDLKAVNLKLLVFLTAAFSIGGTLNTCGVADKLFSLFAKAFPDTFSLPYILLVLAASILLHMLLGSNITTMSVVVPGLMTIGAGTAPAHVLLFLIYIAVCGHFVLPFHHVVILLGEGKGYYSTKELLRFGLPHTILTVATVLVVYLTWWRVMGLF